MEQLRTHLRTSYIVMMLLMIPFTFGIATLFMWITSRKWPKLIDSEGMTLRSGKRLLWTELTKIQPVTVVNRAGVRITGRLDLYFDKFVVPIVTHSLKEGDTVLEFTSKILKVPLASG